MSYIALHGYKQVHLLNANRFLRFEPILGEMLVSLHKLKLKS